MVVVIECFKWLSLFIPKSFKCNHCHFRGEGSEYSRYSFDSNGRLEKQLNYHFPG